MVLCKCGKHEIYAKGLCSTCYKRKRRENPYVRKRLNINRLKYIENHPEKVKEDKRNWQRKNPEKVKESNRRYLNKHPEKKTRNVRKTTKNSSM